MTTHVRTPARSPAQRLAPGRPLLLSGVADGAEGLVLADLARAVAAGASPPAISLAVICRDGSRRFVQRDGLSKQGGSKAGVQRSGESGSEGGFYELPAG